MRCTVVVRTDTPGPPPARRPALAPLAAGRSQAAPSAARPSNKKTADFRGIFANFIGTVILRLSPSRRLSLRRSFRVPGERSHAEAAEKQRTPNPLGKGRGGLAGRRDALRAAQVARDPARKHGGNMHLLACRISRNLPSGRRRRPATTSVSAAPQRSPPFCDLCVRPYVAGAARQRLISPALASSGRRD